MKGRKHSEATRQKMKMAWLGRRRKLPEDEKGSNHWNWKGGREAWEKRLRNNPKHQLNCRMASSVLRSLKRRGGKKNHRRWQDLVGYTTEQLEKRLRFAMSSEHTWKDFMRGKLQIDHIIPVSAFNFSKPEHIDFKRCWALENLQLLSARENQRKHDRLYKPFQPSLTI